MAKRKRRNPIGIDSIETAPRLKFELSFAKVQCKRCGEPRQAKHPCPECGKKPDVTETDGFLQSRQRTVALVQGQKETEASTYSVEDLHLDVIFDSEILSGLVSRIYSAAAKASSGHAAGAAELAKVELDIEVLEKWSNAVLELRPQVKLIRSIKASIPPIRCVYDYISGALTAETIAEAQSLEKAAQSSIDEAASTMAEADELFDKVMRVFDHNDDSNFTGRWLNEIGFGDLENSIEIGQQQFQSHLGKPCGVATAIMVLANQMTIAIICDEQNFWTMVDGHIQLLEQKANELKTLIESDYFIERMSISSHDQLLQSKRAFMSEEYDSFREEVIEILDGAHLIVEQVLKLHLGAACSLFSKVTFEATQGADVSELCNIAKGKKWTIATSLTTPAMRNAYAHRDFELHGDQVVLSPAWCNKNGDTPVTMNVPQLRNEALKVLEVSMAMELALCYVADSLNFDLAIQPRSLPLVRTFLTAIGWTEVAVERRAENVHIAANVVGRQKLANIAMAIVSLKGMTDELVLDLHRSDIGKSVCVIVPLPEYISWSDLVNGQDSTVAFLGLIHRITVDGEPFCSANSVAKLIAASVLQIMVEVDREFKTIRPEMQVWRSLARELQLLDLDRDIGKCMKYKAMASGGLATVPYPNLDVLMDYAGASVPNVPEYVI